MNFKIIKNSMKNKNLKLKIILTGGGTAGHVWPTLTVAEAIKKQKLDTDFLYIGSENGIESEIVPKNHYQYQSIKTGKIRRYFSWENFIDPFKVVKGVSQSKKIIKSFKPDAVFAKGGYVTAPVVFAAWLCKVPVVLHESDSVMGLANKTLSKFAKKIAVSFPTNYYPQKLQKKLFYSGLPIRESFVHWQKCSNVNIKFNVQLPIVLITGGSQGAHFINHSIFKILAKLLKKYNIIHLTGTQDIETAEKRKKKLSSTYSKRYLPYGFLDQEMTEAMKTADLVISRAGANSLFELAAMKKPAIIIPLPSAASDHQNKNAEIFRAQKAVVVLKEDQTIPDKLFKNIDSLLSRPVLLERLSKNISKFATSNAAQKIAEEIIAIIK